MFTIEEPDCPSPVQREGHRPKKLLVFPRRTALVEAGDEPECLHRIVDGWAVQCRFLDDGKRQITGLFVPGDHFDPVSIVRPVASQSLVALTLLTVQCAALSSLRTETGVSCCERWWPETVRLMAIQTEWLVNLGKRNALEKLAHLFCELQLRVADKNRAVFDFPLSQVDLADICGMTPVHINRTLQQMRGERLIELHHRKLEIVNRPALEQLSGFDESYLHI